MILEAIGVRSTNVGLMKVAMGFGAATNRRIWRPALKPSKLLNIVCVCSVDRKLMFKFKVRKKKKTSVYTAEGALQP